MNRKQRRASESGKGSQANSLLGGQAMFDEALRHHQAGRLAEAEQLYRQILALDSRHADSLHLLGVIAHHAGRCDIAVELIGQAIAVRDDVPFFYNNLGNVLKDQGKLDDAVACYQRALTLKRDYAEAFNNLGIVLRDQGKLSDATACFLQATILKPDITEAHINLGQSLQSQDRFDEAVACYKQVLALEPNSFKALNNLGNVFVAQGRLDDAIACHRRILVLQPELTYIHSNLLMGMLYASSVSPVELAASAREFGKMQADPLCRLRPMIRDHNSERKLRIGYVSPDFREHPVNYFFEPLLKLHDRQQFELFAYSNVLLEDAITAKLKNEFDHWRDIQRLSDDDAADLIEADAIDILVDTAGHTSDNRLLVFARKPAPIQVTWLGYPGSTGMKAMDYRISDHYAEPVGMTEHLNVETLWRLPEICYCYQAHENSPAVIDHPPFEDNGYITFGCFNNFARVTDAALATWARILEQVPNSRLLLEIRGLDGSQFRASVEDRLQRLGLPLERVILEPRKRSNQFVLYNRIDIALDPFPAVGGTTSMDTMWMGVPFVTLAGEHFLSRLGVTVLSNAGLPELIAKNIDEYVRFAVNLAQDKDRLRGLRHNLRDRVTASPLMNQAAFARNMEAAYRGMWRKWCAEMIKKGRLDES